MVNIMLVWIGVLILMVGIGLFVWQATNSDNDNNVKRMLREFKKRQDAKREEKKVRREVRQNARIKALRNMEDDLAKQMQEEERKKMTGEARAEKKEKLKDAFSMGSDGQSDNSNDKISKAFDMNIGDSKKNSNDESDSNMFSEEKINQMLGGFDGSNSKKSKKTGNKNKNKNDDDEDDDESDEDKLLRHLK